MKFIPYVMFHGYVLFFRCCYSDYKDALAKAVAYMQGSLERESAFGVMPVPAEKAEKVKESYRWAKTIAFN